MNTEPQEITEELESLIKARSRVKSLQKKIEKKGPQTTHMDAINVQNARIELKHLEEKYKLRCVYGW